MVNKVLELKIITLRKMMADVDTVDPSSDAYKNLISFLDRQSIETLKVLSDAKIKFVSSLARNRVFRAIKSLKTAASFA